MTPRDTSTGNVLEDTILPALKRGGYKHTKGVFIGKRPSGRRHKVDILVEDNNGIHCIVSCKWQQSGGTAEGKIPYEVICLHEALKNNSENNYNKAYIVLGGSSGWTLKEFYLSGGLNKYFSFNLDNIIILSLEDFISKANKGEL